MSGEQNATRLLERAQQLFKQYYTSCFWHLKQDLIVTESTLPIIIKGLRAHGGHDAFIAAGLLERDCMQREPRPYHEGDE